MKNKNLNSTTNINNKNSNNTPNTTIISSQLEDFIEYLSNESKSKETLKSYKADMISFFSWYFNSFDTQHIEFITTSITKIPLTREIILQYKDHLKAINNSSKTINRKISSLKNYNEYLISIGTQNSLSIKKNDIIKIQKTQVSPTDITEADITKFMNKLKENIRNYTIVNLLVYTGLRISEALNLKLQDIDLDNGELIVCNGKGNKDREIFLPLNLVEILKEYLDIRSNTSKYAPYSKYLFVSQQGEKLSTRTVEEIFNNNSRKITPHKLRHFFCTNALENGFNIHEVASMAGHSDINTTLVYTNPSKTAMKNKLNKLKIS